MNKMTIASILCVLGFAPNWLAVAAPFQNRDFDSANINITFPVSPDIGVGYGPTMDMLPGWRLSSGADDVTLLGLDVFLAGVGYASLYDSSRPTVPSFGLYSLGLVPGYDLITGAYKPDVLVQTGDLPLDIRSIRFLNYGSPFELKVNDAIVPLLYDSPPALGDPNFRLYHVAADISAYAGMSVELKFTTIKVPLQSFNGIDSITFSTEPVPEPGSGMLVGAGLVLVVGRGWLRRQLA